jgi:exonuclease SbcC
MRLIKVKLRGFIGIKKGLETDEITVDFSQLAGLVALEGANGIGKTTFLENLQPYRMLPSRTGTLKSHCFLKDSMKELTFEFHGDIYRTVIKIDATTTRSDEGYIYKNGNSASEVDSKVSNYDAYIEDLLGTPALYFSSIFCAQNSKKLSDMRPAELKNLFAEFLRLDRYVKWEDTAKGAFKACDFAASALEAQGEQLNERIKLMGDPANDLKGARKMLADCEENLKEYDSKTVAVTKATELLKKQSVENALNRQRLDDLNKIKAKLVIRQKANDDTFQSDNVERMMQLETLDRDLKKSKAILDIRDSIENAVKVKADGEKENKALHEKQNSFFSVKQQLSVKIQEHNLEIHDSNNRLQELASDETIAHVRRVKVEQDASCEKLNTLIFEIEKNPVLVQAQAHIEAMEKSAGVLDTIDPACTSEVCGLITVSLDNRDALPDAREAMATLKAQMLKDLKVKHDSEIDKLLITETELKRLEDKAAVTRKLEEDKQTASRAIIEELEAKSDKVSDSADKISAQINIINNVIEKSLPAAARHTDLLAAESASAALKSQMEQIVSLSEKAKTSHEADKNLIRGELDEIQEGINAINIIPEAEKQLDETHEELRELRRLQDQEEKNEVRWNIEIPKYFAEVKQKEDLETEVDKLRNKYSWVQGQKQEWDYLRIACSKDGMRALEIEAVAPMITKNSNDLLTMTFGPNYSVRFETQDEEGKEILSIIVIASDGSETHLQYLSGGEKVWILKSLRLAQTLISQEKSGRHFQTALMDEEDGALSADNAMHFIELYRSFSTMANMDLCLYITHRPEAVALADNILRFTPGRIAIV